MPVSDVADSFLRYQLATESLGRSQEEVLDFTKRVTQAMILSGATSEEAHRAAVQLSQGFGKNFKAAAQDLKSVKEQAPVLARIIEKAAGALPGQLLVAAKAGKVNSKLVFDAVRAEGDALDEAFAKRQKTFESLGNLLGNTWLQLIKKFRPEITALIGALEKVVHWVKEWVDDGSAINAIIAGAITAVGALTYALGGLALSAAAAAAPFVAIFYALDELVAFIRGDESFLEDWLVSAFGAEKMEKARAALRELTELVGKFFAALGNDAETQMVAWRIGRAVTAALKSAWDAFVEYAYNSDNPISGLIRWSTAKPGTKAEDKSFFQMTPGEFFGGAGRRGDEYSKRYEAEHPGERAPELGPTEDIPTMPAPWAPPAMPVPVYRSPYQMGGGGAGGGAAPVITNNITVEGNATPAVAREIGTQAGSAVAEILGRDRSAVGAGFGLSP